MQPDKYTKTVLTVIAICLIWISIRLTLTPSPLVAAENLQPVAIDIVAIDGKRFGSLSVSRLDPALPVEMR